MSGLRQIYSEVEGKLNSIVDNSGSKLIKHIHTWNNQFLDLLGKTNNDWSIPFPAVFIQVEIDNIEQQGQRNQIWNCTLQLHIAHSLYNSMNGEAEQNWEVFDFVDIIWQDIQSFKMTKSCPLIAVKNVQDYNHSNLYHFIHEYKFNWEYEYNTNEIPLYPWVYTLSAATWYPVQITGGTSFPQIVNFTGNQPVQDVDNAMDVIINLGATNDLVDQDMIIDGTLENEGVTEVDNGELIIDNGEVIDDGEIILE